MELKIIKITKENIYCELPRSLIKDNRIPKHAIIDLDSLTIKY